MGEMAMTLCSSFFPLPPFSSLYSFLLFLSSSFTSHNSISRSNNPILNIFFFTRKFRPEDLRRKTEPKFFYSFFFTISFFDQSPPSITGNSIIILCFFFKNFSIISIVKQLIIRLFLNLFVF